MQLFSALIIWLLSIIVGARCATTIQFEDCPASDGCQRARAKNNQTLLVCRGYIDVELAHDISALHVCKYDNTTFYLSNVVKRAPALQSLRITDSSFSYLISATKPNNISMLVIHNTTLKRVDNDLAQNMRRLRILDLRNNSLDRLPKSFGAKQHLKEIHLSNNKWNCDEEYITWGWSLNTSIVKDLNAVLCYGEPFNDKSLFQIAKFQKDIVSECPHYCNCRLFNVVRDLEDVLNQIILVNCSNRNLVSLPHTLPRLTKILHLENNSISDLSPIVTNKAYKSVLELYLDSNKVTSIAILEGGKWLETFEVLSLRNNSIKQLPTYALDNALTRNENMPDAVLFYLSDNPWRCDCAYTPHFQEMLMKYEAQIHDLDNVRCRNMAGDLNSNLPIVSLTRSSICHQPSNYLIKPLDLINIILASLICMVLSKLAYDYYHFKKTGRLPWIVTKMP